MNKVYRSIVEKALTYENADLTEQLDILWVKTCVIPLQRAWRERRFYRSQSLCETCSGRGYCDMCMRVWNAEYAHLGNSPWQIQTY